jgi:hypothetical protein
MQIVLNSQPIMIYVEGSNVLTLVQEVSQALGTQEINVHIAPQDWKVHLFLGIHSKSESLSSMDDLPIENSNSTS